MSADMDRFETARALVRKAARVVRLSYNGR
jgi:hypothetical protein